MLMLWTHEVKKGPATGEPDAGCEPQALPVIPRQSGVVKKRCGYQGSRLGSAQVFCGRLAGLAICDNVERDLLPLLARPHARAFDRADMNEDIFASGLRLNKPKPFWLLNPVDASARPAGQPVSGAKGRTSARL